MSAGIRPDSHLTFKNFANLLQNDHHKLSKDLINLVHERGIRRVERRLIGKVFTVLYPAASKSKLGFIKVTLKGKWRFGFIESTEKIVEESFRKAMLRKFS